MQGMKRFAFGTCFQAQNQGPLLSATCFHRGTQDAEAARQPQFSSVELESWKVWVEPVLLASSRPHYPVTAGFRTLGRIRARARLSRCCGCTYCLAYTEILRDLTCNHCKKSLCCITPGMRAVSCTDTCRALSSVSGWPRQAFQVMRRLPTALLPAVNSAVVLDIPKDIRGLVLHLLPASLPW